MNVNQDRKKKIPEIKMYFHLNPKTDRRTYNAPTTSNKIGVVFVSHDGNVPPPSTVRAFYRNPDSIVRISYMPRTAPISDALCYLLLMPYGEMGWAIDLERVMVKKQRVSMQEFILFHLMIRDRIFNPVHHAGKLGQQYYVDSFVKVEGDRLNYIKLHQKQLRNDTPWN